jgi:hypothetical protein
LRRVKENAEKRRVAKSSGGTTVTTEHNFCFYLGADWFLATVHLKRLPVMPREARVVKATPDSVETLRPIPYDTRI